MEEVTDTLETMILMSLDADRATNWLHGSYRVGNISKEQEVGFDVCEWAVKDPMRIESAYTCDLADRQRIYTTRADDLLAHPAEILGDEAEVILLSEQMLIWRGFRKVRRAPDGVSYLGKPAFFYEMHMRTVREDGTGYYWKKFVALSKTGAFIPTFVQGRPAADKSNAEDIVLAASVIEDAHRSNSMLAQVMDATEIKFPVPLDDYKDIFADRDGPMNGSRRKAILHWVARHLRTSTRGNSHEVKNTLS